MDSWIYVLGVIAYAVFQILTSLNKGAKIEPRDEDPRSPSREPERDPLEELLESFRKEQEAQRDPEPVVPPPIIRKPVPVPIPVQPRPTPHPVRVEEEFGSRSAIQAEREAEKPLYANTVAAYQLHTKVESDSAYEIHSKPMLELTRVLHRRNAQAERLRTLLRNRSNVREAILLNEVLSRPIALRT